MSDIIQRSNKQAEVPMSGISSESDMAESLPVLSCQFRARGQGTEAIAIIRFYARNCEQLSMPLYSEPVQGLGWDDAQSTGQFMDEAGAADHEIAMMLRQTGDTAEAVHEEALRRLIEALDAIEAGGNAEGTIVEGYLRVSVDWSELFALWETYHSRRGCAALCNAVQVILLPLSHVYLFHLPIHFVPDKSD